MRQVQIRQVKQGEYFQGKNKMDQLAKDLAETFQAKCYDKETACEYMGKQQWQYSFVIKVLGYM